jgi:hypothetical protein
MRHYHIKRQNGGHSFTTVAFFHGDDAAFQRRFCELSNLHGHGLVAEASDVPFIESIEVIEPDATVKPRRRGKLAS